MYIPASGTQKGKKKRFFMYFLRNWAGWIAGEGTVHLLVLGAVPLKVPVSKCLPHALTTNTIAGPRLICEGLAVDQTRVSKDPSRQVLHYSKLLEEFLRKIKEITGLNKTSKRLSSYYFIYRTILKYSKNFISESLHTGGRHGRARMPVICTGSHCEFRTKVGVLMKGNTYCHIPHNRVRGKGRK